MLKTYESLAKGTYFKPRPRSCPAWSLYIFRHLLCIFYLILFFPFVSLTFIVLFIYWFIRELVLMIPVGCIMLQCGCTFTSRTSQDFLPGGDLFSIISNRASKEEEKRFDLYVFPVVIFNVGSHLYKCLCLYLAGLFEANLIDDELIILWLHLWGTSKCHPVYEYDQHNEPVRIRGIMEDYTVWVNKQVAAAMYKGMSMEIESVFVDYDDNNRITFQLLNGETVVQPQGSVTDDDMRVWNVVKAHWQSQLSMWPALIHTWVHFHFNDLTVNYIEQRWNSGLKHCSNSVMDRIIRSHSYFTAFLNSAGPADGFCNPHMRRWSLCTFLFAPWKVPPVPTRWIHWLFVSDITAFWFKDSDETTQCMARQSITKHLSIGSDASDSTAVRGPIIVKIDEDQKGVSVDLYVGSLRIPDCAETITSPHVTPDCAETISESLSAGDVPDIRGDDTFALPTGPPQVIQRLSSSANLAQKMTKQLAAIRSIQNAMSAQDQLDIRSLLESRGSLRGPDAMPNAMKSVVSSLKKVADPDSFPPIFIRNRLEMFAEEHDSGMKWIDMHRGWHIYKDYLADYYKIIHEEFVLKLHDGGYLKDECLERWITFMEKEGFPGISKCKRHGGYLHIFSTFLWLNVVHASDHTIANNIVRHWGVNCSVVPMMTQQWFREHGDYDYLDVLEGKDWRSRWRIQFYAMRIRVFWGTFGGPWNEGGFHADHMIDSHLHRHFTDIDGITEEERKAIDEIHKGYIEKMKEYDVNWRWLMKVEDLTAGIQY